VKYEDIFPRGYRTMQDAEAGLLRYFRFYNNERPHQSLGYATPAQVHFEGRAIRTTDEKRETINQDAGLLENSLILS
jgi:hypothetical protein